MLQQTQVATALPFYQSFLERFPTVERLARAREADVLAAWSGLGYYRRARHLLAAARTVVRDHAGQVPSDEDAFGGLPGVGRYTRGAVLSIAFDRALPVLDGNVARVLARLAARPWSVRDPRGAKALWELAERLVPRRGAGEWNQALMELGARICTPRAPRCDECPVRSLCVAHARGVVSRYPPAAKRKATERVHWAAAVVRRGTRILVTRRRGTLLDGMWEPPFVEVDGSADPRAVGRRLTRVLGALGIRVPLTDTHLRLRHRITHRDIVVAPWTGAVPAAAPQVDRGHERRTRGAGIRWVNPDRPGVALTGIARKLMRSAGATARNGGACAASKRGDARDR